MSDTSDTDTSLTTADHSALKMLQRDVMALQAALRLGLLATAVAAGSVALLFFYQLRQTAREVEARSELYQQLQEEENRMNGFVEQLREFARVHPDFAPVLGRVGLSPATSAPPATVVTPAAPTEKK